MTLAGRRILAGRFSVLGPIPVGLLLLGAYLPDIVDKSLSLLIGLSGRGYAHSLVVQLVAFGCLAAVLPRHRAGLAPVWLGAHLHLAEDWVNPEVLLAPLLGPIPWDIWDPMESVFGFYLRGGPLVWLEAAAVLYWLCVGMRALATPGGRDEARDTGPPKRSPPMPID